MENETPALPISKEEAYQQLAQAIEMINKMRYAAEKLAAQHGIPMGASRYGLAYELGAEDTYGTLRRVTSVEDLEKLGKQQDRSAIEDEDGDEDESADDYLEPIDDPDEKWVSSSVCW